MIAGTVGGERSRPPTTTLASPARLPIVDHHVLPPARSLSVRVYFVSRDDDYDRRDRRDRDRRRDDDDDY